MRLPLSKRLLACAEYVTPGDRVADIGCDHGYLSIYLLKNNIASTVIASDIGEQPLQSAIFHAEKFGVNERIRFYLSDGVQRIPRDFDTLICAGMGADTMISILDSAPWLRDGRYRLILQCQSKRAMLRRWLSANGWDIRQEQALKDGRFLYTVMEVVYKPGQVLTAGQCWFSPALRRCTAPEAKDYYTQVLFRLQRAVDGQGSQADPEMRAALQELKELKL